MKEEVIASTPPTLDEVLQGFDALRDVVTPPVTLADVGALKSPAAMNLPPSVRRFLEVFGAAEGPLVFQGEHVTFNIRFGSVASSPRKSHDSPRKGESRKAGASTRFAIGLPVGTCEDCGPAYVDTGTSFLTAQVRALLSGSNEPVVIQTQEPASSGRARPGEAYFLGESVAAWVARTAFEQYRLLRYGELAHCVFEGPASALPAADAPFAAAGFRPHPFSRFILQRFYTRSDGAALIQLDGNMTHLRLAVATRNRLEAPRVVAAVRQAIDETRKTKRSP